jgi:FMN reductase
MSILVISTSLNPQSRSRVAARLAFDELASRGVDSRWIDLRELDLPMCDGGEAFAHPGVGTVAEAIAASRAVLLATPVYNFAPAASAKNLLELTGKAWEGKTVALLGAAGGSNAYTAPMLLAWSLMLDFRCVVLPRFVYATGAAFGDDEIIDEDVRRRIADLSVEVDRVSAALGAGP